MAVLDRLLPWRETGPDRPTHTECSGVPVVIQMYSSRGSVAGYEVECPECGEVWCGEHDEIPYARFP